MENNGEKKLTKRQCELIEAHMRGVYYGVWRMARGRGLTDDEVEDMTSYAIADVCRRTPAYDETKATYNTFATRCAMDACRHWLNRERHPITNKMSGKARAVTELDALENWQDEIVDSRETISDTMIAATMALETMPTRCKTVYNILLSGATMVEAARTLGVGPDIIAKDRRRIGERLVVYGVIGPKGDRLLQ
jgi:RNA polymerase sigma factor (sigma-70 family)